MAFVHEDFFDFFGGNLNLCVFFFVYFFLVLFGFFSFPFCIRVLLLFSVFVFFLVWDSLLLSWPIHSCYASCLFQELPPDSMNEIAPSRGIRGGVTSSILRIYTGGDDVSLRSELLAYHRPSYYNSYLYSI